MNKAINFYELKSELSGTGFRDPGVVDALRQAIFSEEDSVELAAHIGQVGFNLHLVRDEHQRLSFIGYSGSIGAGTDHWKMQSFHINVPATDAITLLNGRAAQMPHEEHISLIPIDVWETRKQIEHLKTNKMNTQNLEFLKKSLLNLGFGEKVNKELEQHISKQTPEFVLHTKHEFNQKPVDYQLHFKAGESEGMYFFNKYDATINKGKEQEVNQSFYINKGNGITAKEAFNLMEGRAVHKQLFNKEGEKYQAWLQLDPEKLTQNGSKEIKRFNENYGFDLEKVLTGKGIKEMESADSKDSLLRSIKKGNAQQITVTNGKEETKYFVSASPQFKTIDLYDDKMKRIKREELLQPSQKNSTSQKQTRQQKEGLPEKKQQPRKRKVAI
ncbi:MAG: hypothetical protein ACTHMI_14015 [Mucilaginibacter sp.]